MNNGLLSNFSKLVNTDQDEDNTNKPKVSYVYGKVTNVLNNGKTANVEIDGSTASCPVKSNVTVEKGNRVMIMLRNHDATIVNNVSVPTITADYMKGEDGGKIIKDHMQESLDALKEYVDDIASAIGEKLFPIGSTYLTTTKTNPGAFLGGTWALVNEGYALMSVSADNSGGRYNGSSNSKSVSGVPAHEHDLRLLNEDDDNYVSAWDSYGEIYIPTDVPIAYDRIVPSHTHNMGIGTTYEEGQGYGLIQSASFQDRVMVAKHDGYVRSTSEGDKIESQLKMHKHTVHASSIKHALKAAESGDGGTVDVTPKNFKVYVWYRTA